MSRFKYFCNKFWLFNKLRYLFTPFIFRKKKKRFLFEGSKYLRLNLGCRKKYCYGYANFDENRWSGRVLVSSFSKLPIEDKSVKRVLLDYNAVKDKPKRKLSKISKELSRIIVCGGILSIDNFTADDTFLKIFKSTGFIELSLDSNRLFSVKNFMFSAPVGNKMYYKLDKKTMQISGFQFHESLVFSLDELNRYIGKLERVDLLNVLEFIPTANLEYFLKQVQKALKSDGLLVIKTLNESAKFNGHYVNFFDKGNLSQLVTESGFFIKNLKIEDNSLIMEIKKSIERGRILDTETKKICSIGQYMLHRYDQLGFTHDGIARAIERLDLEHMLIDGMRNQTFESIQKTIVSFRPTYILAYLRETLPILFDIKDELKKIGTKVIFWFCDPGHPEKMDLSGVVDIMFLSNRGQLDEYRQAYNIKRVYYMPQGIDPAFMFYNQDLPEIYDIGFSGAISNVPLHRRRRELIDKLKDKYNIKITNTTRNNISEFYSESKTVFGISDFNYELYTSNRFFNALGCGAVYITGKFKGIELLTENRKHLLWFESEEELFELLDYYLSHDNQRKSIRRQAQALVHSKHTWSNRIKNILDIVEGKTEEFYGFL